MKNMFISMLLITLISFDSFAVDNNKVISSFSTSYGYSLNKQLLIDCQIGYNDLIFKLNSAISVDNGTVGKLNNNIGWNEYPSHIISEGTYFSSIDFGLGFNFFKNVFLIGYIGLGIETSYRNSYDATNEIFPDDSYYLINHSRTALHFMSEVGYVWHILSISMIYSEETDIGFKVGLFWDGHY